MILFFDPPSAVSASEVCSSVRAWLLERWTAAAWSAGHVVEQGTRIDRRGVERGIGVDVQVSTDSAETADYLCKWGVSEELSAAWGKSGGRDGRWSPLGLLMEAEARGGWAQHRWVEYETVTAAKHSIRWSPRLRSVLAALDTTDPGDAAILERTVSDHEAARERSTAPVEDTVTIAGSTWNRLVRSGRQHEPGEALRSRVLAAHFDHLRTWMVARAGP